MRNMSRKFQSATGLTTLIVSLFIAAPASAGSHMIGGQGSGGYAAGASTYSVNLNKTEIVRLPSPASAVIIGNPNVADVSVHASDTLFVVGRGFGTTNLLVLDAQGQTMMNANVQVINNPTVNDVRIFNGSNRSSYNCVPNCQPAPVLGDDPEFIDSFTSSSTSSISNGQALPAQDSSLTSIQDSTTGIGY